MFFKVYLEASIPIVIGSPILRISISIRSYRHKWLMSLGNEKDRVLTEVGEEALERESPWYNLKINNTMTKRIYTNIYNVTIFYNQNVKIKM